MLRTALSIFILGAFLVFPSPLRAQWDIDATAQAGLQAHQNVFKSPRALRTGGQRLGADSLIQSDLVRQYRWALDAERTLGARHELEAAYESSLQHYQTFDTQNEQQHDLELSYGFEASDAWALEGEVSRRWNRSVGTNVLGDQLSRVFSYRQWELAPEVSWTVSETTSLKLTYQRRWRTYNTQEGLAPLSYDGQRGVLIGWLRFEEADRPQWVFTRIQIRQKDYREYRARNRAGQQAPSHPTNRLQYASARVKYNIDLNEDLSWNVGTMLRRRADPFEGYYDYWYTRLDSGVEWDVAPTTTLEAEVRWRRYRYDAKDAPQPSRDTSPSLRYDYLDGSLRAAHNLRPYLTAYARVATDRRQSNVELRSRRTRRSYSLNTATIGLRMSLSRLYRRVR
jgi:hypothetical protein